MRVSAWALARRRVLFSMPNWLTRARFVAAIWFLFAGLADLAVVFALGHRWLGPGLPSGDLGGTVAGLARWRRLILNGEVFSSWNGSWFCGHSRALFNLNGGMELAYAPFLAIGDELTAVKVGALVYFGLAGMSAYALFYPVIRRRWIAFVMGLAYAVHPIHLSVAVADSHANFPPFYFLQPILALLMLRVSQRPSRPNVAGLAMVAALTGWVDLERLAILLPWLIILSLGTMLYGCWNKGGISSRGLESARASFKGVFGAGVLSACLLAVVLVPAMAEKAHHAMFSKETLTSSREFFSIRNPLYYLDRQGTWLKDVYAHLPPEQSHDAGTFYLGTVLCGLAVLGIVFPPRARRLRGLVYLGGLSGMLALASAYGPYGGYESLCSILDEIFLQSSARKSAASQLLGFFGIVTFGLILLVVGMWFASRHEKRSCLPRLAFLVVLAACLLYARPFQWFLRYVPPYAEMRNPAWFATSMPPLAVSLVACIGLGALWKRVRCTVPRLGITLLVIGLLVWDFCPYRSSFDHVLDGRYVEELREIALLLENDGKEGRVLSRESYNPHADMLYAFSGRPTGFYWLNWMAPAGTSRLFLEEVYRKLHRPETIERALELLGEANVRYVLYDLTQGPLPPPSDGLRLFYEGQYFALYENRRVSRYIAFLPDSDSQNSAGDNETQQDDVVRCYGRERENSVVADVKIARPGILRVSESLHPGWRAWVDGKPVSIEPVLGAFLGIRMEPGEHRVRLKHEWAWYAPAACGLSAGGFLVCLWLIGKPLFWRRRNASEDRVRRRNG